MGYALYLERRLANEDRAEEVEQLTYNLAWSRWQEVYHPDSLTDTQEEVGVDDADEVDAYFDRVARGETFAMSGAEIEEGWQ